jgi:hypothetical protein
MYACENTEDPMEETIQAKHQNTFFQTKNKKNPTKSIKKWSQLVFLVRKCYNLNMPVFY